MGDNKIKQYGDELYDCWRTRRTVAPLREREPDIAIGDAYRIQERFVARRVAAGETIVGKKIGVTSKVVMALLVLAVAYLVYYPAIGPVLSNL